MDPITTFIVSSLAAGAAAALEPTATQAVKDAYAGVKRIIQDKYQDIRLAGLEKRPDSSSQQEALAENLEDVQAGADEELLTQVQTLVEALQQGDAATAAEQIGVDVKGLKAQSARIARIRAGDVGVRLEDVELQGDLDISDVTVGAEGAEDDAPNP